MVHTPQLLIHFRYTTTPLNPAPDFIPDTPEQAERTPDESGNYSKVLGS